MADLYPGKSALGGIYTGLVSSASPHNLVVAADMPFLNYALLRHLMGLSAGFDVVMPLVNGDLRIGLVDGWKPVDPTRVQFVANSPAEERWPGLACEGPGKFLCVYTKGTPDGKVQVCARPLKTE